MTTTPVASVTDTQTTGTTESDVLIWAEMMTGTYTPCVPLIIVRTMTGYCGLYVRLNDYSH